MHLEDPSINAIRNAAAIDFVHIKENWDWYKPFSRYGFEFNIWIYLDMLQKIVLTWINRQKIAVEISIFVR